MISFLNGMTFGPNLMPTKKQCLFGFYRTKELLSTHKEDMLVYTLTLVVLYTFSINKKTIIYRF